MRWIQSQEGYLDVRHLPKAKDPGWSGLVPVCSKFGQIHGDWHGIFIDIHRKIMYMMMIEWDIRRKIIYISGMNGTMAVFLFSLKIFPRYAMGFHGDWTADEFSRDGQGKSLLNGDWISMIFHGDMDPRGPRMKRFEEIILWIQVWGRWGGVIFWDIDQPPGANCRADSSVMADFEPPSIVGPITPFVSCVGNSHLFM